MSEVENVLVATGFAHRVEDTIANKVLGTIQGTGVNIALHAHVRPQALPRLGHIHRLIHADDIHARLAHALQHARTATDVENQRRIGMGLLHLLHDALLVG